MYWCCGKTGESAPGCRFGKHESKEDDEDDLFEKEKDDEQKKNTKCTCCKQRGHHMSECDQDPNLKTTEKQDVDQENERVLRLKDQRKTCADYIVHTTQFLNECLKKEENKDNVFGLGSMAFDDFNYGYHNGTILISEEEIKKLNKMRSSSKKYQSAN